MLEIAYNEWIELCNNLKKNIFFDTDANKKIVYEKISNIINFINDIIYE